ncbi:Crp/Fnr family transcriptional regulator [Sedimentitalea sp. XS_ASV28]|uniref:Crp/Fnr family transcriptional regulator n=1 Tax=Sedimentitalea sp. XS_ASV28 TaxID=3241296 RepID=UPI0035142155
MAWSAQEVTNLISDSKILKRPLPQSAVAALLSRGSIKSFSKGALILQRGAQEPRFFVLLKGTARLSAHTVSGHEFVSIFVEPGNFWGVHPCLEGVAESHDAIAETDVEVLAVPAKALRDLMWENRDIQEALVSFLCQRFRMALDVAEQFATWTPRARLAWRLLSMAKSHGIAKPSKRGMEIRISQESLASMINLSRQRTNILLKEMEREKLVSLEYGRIRVHDPDAMQRLLDDPT